MLAFQHRHYLPLAVGRISVCRSPPGSCSTTCWGMMILAGVLRLVWSHHVTFFINSLAHMWGTRPYTEDNTARDNPVLAVVTYGEGYHNFHHIFAHDYRNGVRWWQWDPTKWLIARLAPVGLTRRLKRTPGSRFSARCSPCSSSAPQRRLADLPQRRPLAHRAAALARRA